MKVAVKNVIEKKEKAESSYQEASKVIGDMQRTITELTEKLKVMQSLYEAEREGTHLRQRRGAVSVVASAPVQSPALAQSPAAVSARPPAVASLQTPAQVVSSPPDNLSSPRATPAVSAPAGEVSLEVPVLASLQTQATTQTQAQSQAKVTLGVAAAPVPEGWNEEWEEVWEDNESGELISHQSSRVEHVCKKCDKQLDNENIFRQHMKEHLKKDIQIPKCHWYVEES